MVRNGKILDILKKRLIGFVEDMEYGSKTGAKDNSTIFGLDGWQAQALIYEIGNAVAGAGLHWETEFGFGCKFDS